MADGTYLDDPDFTLYQGDALETLRTLPDESVHCAVTSPPYWGLRDYGTGTWEGGDSDCDHKQRANHGHDLNQGDMASSTCKCGARRVDQQLGLEPTPDAYVTNMVTLFREVRRVLRRDGTCWLNLGDSYWNGGGEKRDGGHGFVDGGKVKLEAAKGSLLQTRASTDFGLKPKDLVGIPWRVAFALQNDGWYLRSDIIWAKPNPMPESVTDRPTKAHEYLFLLTRSARYFFDQDAIRERYGDAEREWWNENRTAPGNPNRNDGGGVQSRPGGPDGRRKTGVMAGDGSIQHRNGERWPNLTGRNARSVWEIATQPYPEAHFATFPEELARRCIAAGTSERGCCPVCGAPWEREVEAEYVKSPVHGAGSVVGRHYETGANNWDGSGMPRLDKRVTTTGWKPGCDHDLELVPCVVLDPFMGSGTVAHVARKLGRRSVGIELNPDYCELAARRMQQLSLLA